MQILKSIFQDGATSCQECKCDVFFFFFFFFFFFQMLCVFGLDFSTGYCMLTKPSDHLFTCFFHGYSLSLFLFFFFLFIHRPPSDLIFVITELPHERFSRNGNGVFYSFTFVLFRRCFVFWAFNIYTSSNLPKTFSFFFFLLFFLSSHCSADVHHVATITLAQALGRHELVLQHLDGRTLVRPNLFHIFFFFLLLDHTTLNLLTFIKTS